MQTERLVDHQITVEVVSQDGRLIIRLPDGQQLPWPVSDPEMRPGTYYLTLSPLPTLPTKTELAKLVLQEILKV